VKPYPFDDDIISNLFWKELQVYDFFYLEEYEDKILVDVRWIKLLFGNKLIIIFNATPDIVVLLLRCGRKWKFPGFYWGLSNFKIARL